MGKHSRSSVVKRRKNRKFVKRALKREAKRIVAQEINYDKLPDADFVSNTDSDSDVDLPPFVDVVEKQKLTQKQQEEAERNARYVANMKVIHNDPLFQSCKDYRDTKMKLGFMKAQTRFSYN